MNKSILCYICKEKKYVFTDFIYANHKNKILFPPITKPQSAKFAEGPQI